MSNNDQSMNVTLQGKLVIEFVKLFKNAVVKKVDDGNYLDIHMPDINPKKGTHLWFNTPKSGGIRVGFFCRDKDFKEETLKNHPDSIEAYSNGLRLKGHPIYDDIETALDAAKNFIGYLTTKDAEVEVKKEDELSNDTESSKQEKAMNESDQIFEATEFDEEGKPISTVEDSTDMPYEKWTTEYITKLIEENNYGSGSIKGDDLILRIASHPNTSDGWLEDFCLSGVQPIAVILEVAKNPSVDKYLLEELYYNSDIRVKLSVISNPLCPKHLLKNMVDSSKDEEHDLELYFNWLLKAVAGNSNTPEDLLNELVNHECYFVQRAAASNQSFAISKAIENLESQSRYVLEGILANPSAKEDTKSKIQELLSDSEKYPEHWMEISANAKTEFLEVHANRFHGKLNSEGSLIYDEVHYEDGFESDYDIDELQGAEESFLKEEGIQDHATETYLYDGSFYRVSVYIPNYEGTAVSTVNVYDVLRGWIAAYKIEDLDELIEQCEEYREWMFEVEDIGKVLGMFHHQD